MARLGPLVRPEVRRGGQFLRAGPPFFVIAMAAIQYHYAGYSDLSNYVSDLGGPSSPYPWAFSVAVMFLGATGAIGAYLIRSAFPNKRSPKLGLGFLLIANFGAILVGIFPEQYAGPHALFSGVSFFAAGFALLFLALGMLRDTRWDGYRAYTLISALVTFGGLALFLGHVGSPDLAGLWERVVIAPILLWGVLAGTHLARMPTFAPVPAGGLGSD